MACAAAAVLAAPVAAATSMRSPMPLVRSVTFATAAAAGSRMCDERLADVGGRRPVAGPDAHSVEQRQRAVARPSSRLSRARSSRSPRRGRPSRLGARRWRRARTRRRTSRNRRTRAWRSRRARGTEPRRTAPASCGPAPAAPCSRRATVTGAPSFTPSMRWSGRLTGTAVWLNPNSASGWSATWPSVDTRAAAARDAEPRATAPPSCPGTPSSCASTAAGSRAGGSGGGLASPQVISGMSTSTSHHRIEMLAWPRIRHGDVPERCPESSMLPTLKSAHSTLTPAEKSIMKPNGSKTNSASKSRWPLIPKPSMPAWSSTCAPNCTDAGGHREVRLEARA